MLERGRKSLPCSFASRFRTVFEVDQVGPGLLRPYRLSRCYCDVFNRKQLVSFSEHMCKQNTSSSKL